LQQLTVRLNNQLNNRNYTVVHADSTRDHRGIDTAFIYDEQCIEPARAGDVAADDELLHPLCSKNDGIGS
jgi:hypothetical protein